MKVQEWLLWIVGWNVCFISGVIVLSLTFLFIVAHLIIPLIPIPGASDYKTKLPNGYYLMRQYSGSSMIFREAKNGSIDPGTAVGPSEYGILMAISGHYVVGNLDTEEKAYKVPEIPDRYFIIDTSTDKVMKELSFEEYEKKMRELGFEKLPNLFRPNKLTRFVK